MGFVSLYARKCWRRFILDDVTVLALSNFEPHLPSGMLLARTALPNDPIHYVILADAPVPTFHSWPREGSVLAVD